MDRARVFAQSLADFSAKHSRQHQVKQDHIRKIGQGPLQSGGSIKGAGDLESLFFQVERQQFGQILFILNDQNSFHQQAPCGRSVICL